MQHRHLTHEQYTLAAIDEIIARGKRRDWAELRTAVPEWEQVLAASDGGCFAGVGCDLVTVKKQLRALAGLRPSQPTTLFADSYLALWPLDLLPPLATQAVRPA